MTIADNGCGMSYDELFDAMKYGSLGKKNGRAENDLGRFGLGLKSASLSQCRKLTVVSKKDGAISAMAWDRPPIKDVVELANYLRQFSFDELTDIVVALIDNPQESTLKKNEPVDSFAMGEISEDEIERIINTEDSTAKIVVKTTSGNQRIYKKSIVAQLKRLYRGCCQICGTNPMEEYSTIICEAHHIDYFSFSQNNNAGNIIILCPNHHRLIHMLNPQFKRESLSFVFDNGITLPIKMNYHLIKNKPNNEEH